MLTIRPEKKEDYAAVREVNLSAFGREAEAMLVESLRKSADFIPSLSMVAIHDGHVVGYILFSASTIETQQSAVVTLALAPVAVRPEFQNRGIGLELVQQGLNKCRRLGYTSVVVVGHPAYYPRFGFTSATAKGLKSPFPGPDEAFMVLELTSGALDGIRGTVKFPPAFDAVTE